MKTDKPVTYSNQLTREELIKEAREHLAKYERESPGDWSFVQCLVDFHLSQKREIVYPEKTNEELEEMIYSCAIERTMLGGCFLNKSNIIELVLKIKELNKGRE